jgi:hypothetical protein
MTKEGHSQDMRRTIPKIECFGNEKENDHHLNEMNYNDTNGFKDVFIYDEVDTNLYSNIHETNIIILHHQWLR